MTTLGEIREQAGLPKVIPRSCACGFRSGAVLTPIVQHLERSFQAIGGVCGPAPII